MAFAVANKNEILCEAPRNGWQSKISHIIKYAKNIKTVVTQLNGNQATDSTNSTHQLIHFETINLFKKIDE